MPNWCDNTVTITHSDPFKIKALEDAMNEGKFLSHVIPVPKDLTDTLAGYPGADKEAEHNAQMARNIELYGAKDWYDFCVAKWGTKWDVDCSVTRDSDNTVTAVFESAWSPPVGVYEELVDQGFEVRAYYYEPGMAYCGKWEDGCDDYYEYGGETSETVRDVIGEELDDMYCISESMKEWEEENEEN